MGKMAVDVYIYIIISVSLEIVVRLFLTQFASFCVDELIFKVIHAPIKS